MSKTVTVKAVHAVTICVKPGKAKTQTSAAVPAELKRVEPGTKMTMDADDAAALASIGAVEIVAEAPASDDEKAAKKAAKEAEKAAKEAAAEAEKAAKEAAEKAAKEAADKDGEDAGKNLV